MKFLKPLSLVILAGMLTMLAACGGSNPLPNEEPQTNPANNQVNHLPSDSEVDADPSENSSPEQAAPDPEEPSPYLPPLRQQLEFATKDGRTLEGIYYPAKELNAPLVVMMHWAPGSMEDWSEIARWLQNRQDEVGFEVPAPIFLASNTSSPVKDWLDNSWFPPMSEEVSFAVMVFNFGGYGNSIGSRETWLIDAESAIHFAASLPEINPHQISALGASIGSDGVVDACYLLNDLGEMGTCVGAFSLSPGNYLTDTFNYEEAVAMLDQEGHPVWCLAAEDDGGSPEICLSAGGELFRSFIFPGNFHGMKLIEDHLYPLTPPLDYDALQLVQEWLEVVYLITLNQFSLE